MYKPSTDSAILCCLPAIDKAVIEYAASLDNAASGAVATGVQEVWAVYQRLGDKERALLLAVAKAFSGGIN